MDKISPHPSRDKWAIDKDGAVVSQPWNRWFEDVRSRLNTLVASAASTVGTLWADIDKVGSKITDIESRNHADLQNINSSSYTHLSQSQAADLTDTGDTELHYHLKDRIHARNSSIGRI